MLKASFVNTHFVDAQFHRQHSQLLHRHKEVIELLYVIAGCGRYIVSEREYYVQAGDLIICNANTLHGEALLREHEMQSYCSVLTNLQVPSLPPNALIGKKCDPVVTLTLNKSPVEHIYSALHFLNTQKEKYQEECELLANTLLNIVYKEVTGRNIIHRSDNRKSEELIQCITEYLDEHYMEDISLQELASLFHLDYYYLAHFFKAKTNMSPLKYVIQRRIGEAQNLLMNSEMQISEIGGKMGFYDSSYFSTMFKKYVGLAPSQYRKHFSNKNIL